MTKHFQNTPREKCPSTEFFLVPIFLYSVRIQENTDQKKTPYLDDFSRSDKMFGMIKEKILACFGVKVTHGI